MNTINRVIALLFLMNCTQVLFSGSKKKKPVHAENNRTEELVVPAEQGAFPVCQQNANIYTWRDANILEQYIRAQFEHHSGSAKKAHHYFDSLLKLDKPPVYVYEGYIRFLSDVGKMDVIVQLLQKFDETFKDHADVQLIFAIALKKVGRVAEGNAKLVELSSRFPLHQDIMFHAVQAYLQLKEPDNALAAIDRFLSNASKQANSHAFRFLKAQVHLQTRQYDKALEELNGALDKNPYFDRALLLRAMVHEQQGKTAEAQKGFEAYLEMTNNADTTIRQHLHELKTKQKMLVPYLHKPRLLVPKKVQFVVIGPTDFNQAVMAFERKQFDKALVLIEKHLEQYGYDVKARLFKIQIYVTTKQNERAIKLLKEWIIEDPMAEIWQETLHLLSYADVSRAVIIDAFKELQEKYSKNMFLSMHLADLYLRERDQEQAIKQLENAYNCSIDDTIKEKILFQIGMLYFEKGTFDKLAILAKKAEKLSISFAPLLNLLGYFYVTKGHDIQKGRQFIEKAIKLDPHNIHFLDSKGLVLLKKKLYNRACSFYKVLHKYAPTDSTITMHFAKAQYGSGEQKEALETMRSAHRYARDDREKQRAAKLLQMWAQNK